MRVSNRELYLRVMAGIGEVQSKTESRKGSTDDHCRRAWLDLKYSRDASQNHATRHSRGALSSESLLLVKWASRRLTKRSRGKDSVVEPLYARLESLSSLIPNRSQRKKTCVISDALSYLGYLKRRYEKLRRGLVGNASGSEMFYIPTQVEVRAVEEGLQIQVRCENSSGLTADLLEALQNLGLVLEEVDISCKNNRSLNLDAQGKVQIMEGEMAEIETVKQVLSETIKSKKM